MSDLSTAESRMKVIEEKLTSLETLKGNNSSGNGDNTAIVEEAMKAYQKQLLEKLKLIRDSLMSEGGDVSTIRKERDALAEENKQLKKEVERLNYRVRHLVKSLEEEEDKNAKK